MWTWSARRTALWLVESGQVQVEPLITRRYRYEQAPEAYRFIYEHPERGEDLLDYGQD
jgi:threonine dehydrogenase-like Zn-dependent dehydrogenase